MIMLCLWKLCYTYTSTMSAQVCYDTMCIIMPMRHWWAMYDDNESYAKCHGHIYPRCVAHDHMPVACQIPCVVHFTTFLYRFQDV